MADSSSSSSSWDAVRMFVTSPLQCAAVHAVHAALMASLHKHLQTYALHALTLSRNDQPLRLQLLCLSSGATLHAEICLCAALANEGAVPAVHFALTKAIVIVPTPKAWTDYMLQRPKRELRPLCMLP